MQTPVSNEGKKGKVASHIANLHTIDGTPWSEKVAAEILRHFKLASETVPAYRAFLADNHIDPASIHTTKDICNIPSVSKQNYLRAYPWEDLCTEGSLSNDSLVLTATSGSTGQPSYIPRKDDIHEASSIFFEHFVRHSQLDPKKRTLVVVCFGMGVWIGGLLTYESFRRASARGWPLTLITPGVNKKEVFDALKNIGPSYDQLILCGYPPFVKDTLDESVHHNIDWERWDMRIMCAAESFSESFRDYLMKKTGIQNPYRGVANIYGLAELGTIAIETPLSILLRRLAINNPALYTILFHDAGRLPTLAQYIPELTACEMSKDDIVYATGGTAMPLVRYDTGDHGGIFDLADARRKCAEAGVDLSAEIDRAGIADTISDLPFIYIYERADLSAKLYGAIIYPEHIKRGLQRPELESHITGRFTMTTEHDEQENEYLEVNIELLHGITDGEVIRDTLVKNIVEHLCASSSEYQNNHANMHERVYPRIVFWPHEHHTYFHPGGKQKWVIHAKK